MSKPKLIVRALETGTDFGGLVLCNADGDPLPDQIETVYETKAGDCPVVTVRFWVDGRNIKLETSGHISQMSDGNA